MTDLSRVVVVDLETSGLDPARHGMLELGAVFLCGTRENEAFERRIRLPHELDWDARALEVNGIARGELFDPARASELEALRNFFAWVDGPFVLAGMNVGKFDHAFLAAAMARHPGQRWPKFGHRTLDLHSLAIGYAVRHGLDVDVLRLTTDAIYQMLEMPEEPKPHRALNGARMEAMAFRKILFDPGYILVDPMRSSNWPPEAAASLFGGLTTSGFVAAPIQHHVTVAPVTEEVPIHGY